MLLSKLQGKKAFTLVELLVVTSIIVVILAITLAHYRAGNQQLALKRAAHKLSQDIRRAQEMAMSTREFQGNVPPGGYGLLLRNFNARGIDFVHLYMIAADQNGDNIFWFSEEVERVQLESGIKIKNLYSVLNGAESEVSTLFFNFIPPAPRTCILGCVADGAKIILSLDRDSSATRTIEINKTGLINIVD